MGGRELQGLSVEGAGETGAPGAPPRPLPQGAGNGAGNGVGNVPALPALPGRGARLAALAAPVGWSALSLALVLLGWQLATEHKLELFVRFTSIPTPRSVFDALVAAIGSATFLDHIGHSVRRIAIGFGVALLVAVPLGLAIGRYRLARALLLPAIEVFRPIPAIAWVPMAIMLWPTNETSICFITFLGAFFPILVNTVHGVTSTDAVLLRAASTLGASEMFMLRAVLLPSALPAIVTGCTVGIGVAWVSLIAAEMISGQFGIGYFTWEAYSLVQYPDIALGMATIGLLGLASSELVRRGGALAMPWLAYAVRERH